MSTFGPLPLPTFTPMKSIGAHRAPPITTVPLSAFARRGVGDRLEFSKVPGVATPFPVAHLTPSRFFQLGHASLHFERSDLLRRTQEIFPPTGLVFLSKPAVAWNMRRRRLNITVARAVFAGVSWRGDLRVGHCSRRR
jgi:hypothetical protein